MGKLGEEISLSRTRKSIAKFIDSRPEYANLKVGETERVVPPQELLLGQIIILRPGEKIPVDAVVTKGTGTVDMKARTGESEQRVVWEGDRLYSGSINHKGSLVYPYDAADAGLGVEKCGRRNFDEERALEPWVTRRQ